MAIFVGVVAVVAFAGVLVAPGPVTSPWSLACFGVLVLVSAFCTWWVWHLPADERKSLAEDLRTAFREDTPTPIWLFQLAWHLLGLAGAAVGLGWSLRRWAEEEDR